MSLSSYISLSSGILTSTLLNTPKKPITIGLLGTSTLFYAGSMLEFENLVTLQPIKKNKMGYWLFCGGMVSLGMVCGGIMRGIGNTIDKHDIFTKMSFRLKERNVNWSNSVYKFLNLPFEKSKI